MCIYITPKNDTTRIRVKYRLDECRNYIYGINIQKVSCESVTLIECPWLSQESWTFDGLA
ncbi:MAG: hypothetical protein ACK4E2_05785 [Pseudothermotoga sp.]